MYYKGKNVLVAGGSGMTGQSLIRKLINQGASVRATQYKSRKIILTHKNLEVISCDLKNDEEAQSIFKDMDMVFLCAAKVGGAKLIKEDPSSLIIYNLDLHAKLMYLASKMKLEKCAFISSSYVYPDTGKPNVESEGFKDDPWIPLNYGLGWIKRYLETLCKHFHMTSQTKYAIIRPANIFGPYDNFNIDECHVVPALIVKAVDQMNPFEVWGNGEDIRCFTYVDDLVDGLMLTVEKYAVAEALNICPKESHTIKDVIKHILDLLNFNPKIIFNSNKPSLIPYKVSDPGKALEILGWEAKISLREGLKQTIDWYIKNRKTQAYAAR
ncbi:MAG: NAD-dependent epimerase/dehydratase family protein [Elusimicrobia bacterium]|nr:NAD-dependent epimerase/dehydratase family protein [Elusimicrobiota bacterium]